MMNPGDGNKTVKMTRAQQQALHEKRLTRILDVAVAGGNEVVILGAFGCGALRMIRRLWQLRFPMCRSIQKVFQDDRAGHLLFPPG